jgi:hypothetical protein
MDTSPLAGPASHQPSPRSVQLMHLPAQRLGVGDVLILSNGNHLPISLEIWNHIDDANGFIRFYVRESTAWQVTMHKDEIAAVLR